MAITQTRMLALIKIADDFKTQLLSTNRTVLDIIRALPIQPSPEELLSTIQSIQHLHLQLTINPQALEILSTERAHFKLNQRRNTRQMLRARKKRGLDLDNAPPRNTAPHAITVKESNYSTFFDKPDQKLFTGAVAQYNTVKPLSDADLSAQLASIGIDMKVVEQKIAMNAQHKEWNMAIPYPDPYDDSIPLSDDHKRHLGLPVDDDDSPF